MQPKPRWRIKRAAHQSSTAILEGYSPLEQAILLARGIRSSSEAKFFLDAQNPVFHDPFFLKNMEPSVNAVLECLKENNEIGIYADYDADGISSAALLYRFFREHEIDSKVYFPDRFKEGYGLNKGAIERLADEGVRLLITVDCGIRGWDEIDLANTLGMRVIVSDHHIPGVKLPETAYILNPKQENDEYPFKELAGVGVAYKFAEALSSAMPGSSDVSSLLELVAIGTVADLVPLVDENRHLVQEGLSRLNETSTPGIHALMDVAGLKAGAVGSTDIGFGLGPRINAAGRLASALQAFELLTAQRRETAQHIAQRLDRLNKERQQLTVDVLRKIEDPPPTTREKVIFSFDEAYHPGVVGLAASRISDRYYRPAIIGQIEEQEIRASARSIPGFDITQALESVADLLVRFGGHQAAAGFTLEKELKEKFIDRFLAVSDAQIDKEMLVPLRDVDVQVEFDAIDDRLLSFLDALEPFGHGNPQPVFCTGGVNVLAKRTVGRDNSHLKLTLKQAGRPFDAIGFRLGEHAAELPEVVDVAFSVERNTYLGYETIQLRVVDIRPTNSLDDPQQTEWVNR